MRGTEKQIAFANKLIENMNIKFNELVEFFADKDENQVKAFKDGKEKYNRVFEESYAGDVIELLKDITYTDCIEYYKSLCAGVRVGAATDPICKKIMKEVYDK